MPEGPAGDADGSGAGVVEAVGSGADAARVLHPSPPSAHGFGGGENGDCDDFVADGGDLSYGDDDDGNAP